MGEDAFENMAGLRLVEAIDRSDLDYIDRMIRNDRGNDLINAPVTGVKMSGSSSALAYAIRFGSLNTAQGLVDRGAAIDGKRWDGLRVEPPIHDVMKHTFLDPKDFLDFFKRNGADFQIRDSYGHTPLGAACRLDEEDLADALVDYGAHFHPGETESLTTDWDTDQFLIDELEARMDETSLLAHEPKAVKPKRKMDPGL